MSGWRKSTYSNSSGQCVEVLRSTSLDEVSTLFLVRDSKDNGTGSILTFTPKEWGSFIQGVKAGEFDDLSSEQESGTSKDA